jgi:hypothetical protein
MYNEPISRHNVMISTDEVSTDRLTQNPWPPPAVSSGTSTSR